jgi:hypothetical protein
MKKQEFFNLNLPKWPALLVVGKPVTREQAMEILIRTDSLYFSCNDYEFSKQLSEYLFDVELERAGFNQENTAIAKKLGVDESNSWAEIFNYKEAKIAEVDSIPLNYLENDRIVSSWIGGPKGWCDWDGNIYTANYNIGKWPSVQEVYEDWKRIATAFPFLELRAQLLNCEAGEEGAEPKAVVEFVIKNGKVRMVEPKKLLTQPKDIDFASALNFSNPHRERGCTIQKFKEAVDYCRSKMLQFKD